MAIGLFLIVPIRPAVTHDDEGYVTSVLAPSFNLVLIPVSELKARGPSTVLAFCSAAGFPAHSSIAHKSDYSTFILQCID